MMVAGTMATADEPVLMAAQGDVDPAQVRAELLIGFADLTIPRQHRARHR